MPAPTHLNKALHELLDGFGARLEEVEHLAGALQADSRKLRLELQKDENTYGSFADSRADSLPPVAGPRAPSDTATNKKLSPSPKPSLIDAAAKCWASAESLGERTTAETERVVTAISAISLSERCSTSLRQLDTERSFDLEGTSSVLSPDSPTQRRLPNVTRHSTGNSWFSQISKERQQQAKWSFECFGEAQRYSPAENSRIEDAFWRGAARVHIRSDDHKGTPMEIWFKDMIQYNPITKKKSQIERIPPSPMWLNLYRRVLGCSNGESFAQYEQKQQELVSQLEKHRATGPDEYGAGICSKLVRSGIVSNIFLVAILLNAVWLGIETEANDAPVLYEAPVYIQVVEYFFAVFFAGELLLRFGAYRRKLRCLASGAFLFDFALVLLNLCDVAVIPVVVAVAGSETAGGAQHMGSFSALRVARLMRLTRIGRMAQLLRRVPEAAIVMQGIRKAWRLLTFTFLLELLLIYTFGIIFRTSVTHQALVDESFSTLPAAMYTLLVRGVFLDTPMAILQHEGMGTSLGFLFILFVLLGCYLLMNVLVGTICQVISEVSREQREEADVEFLVSSVMDIIECYADPIDNRIRLSEVELMLANPEMRVALDRFGVDMQGLRMAVASAQSGEGDTGVSISEFLELLLRVRRSNNASFADVMQLRTFVQREIHTCAGVMGSRVSWGSRAS